MSLNRTLFYPKSSAFRQLLHERSDLLAWLLALLVGSIGTSLFHLPQFSSRFDVFPGDRGDARLVAYLMEHWYQVFRGAENWLSPTMFYPVQGTIGYADLLLGYGIFYSVPRSLGMGIFESAEFTIIFFNFLNYLVCFLLLNKVLRFNLLASCAGAVFFAFNSPKLIQMGHVQLQPMLFLPLFMIFVILFVQKQATLSQKGALGLLLLAVVSLGLQLLTGFYAAWFLLFWSTLFLATSILFGPTRLFIASLLKRFWLPLVASGGFFLLCLIPFAMAYLPILRSTGGRSYEETLNLIPLRWSLLLMGDRNWLWSPLSEMIKRAHPVHPELQIGVGLVPSLTWLGITIFGIWLLIKNFSSVDRVTENLKSRTTHLFLAQLILVTSVVYLIGIKYTHDFSPWQYVYTYFPGGRAIRAVARFVLMLALPMGIAFAFVIHHVYQRISLSANRAQRIAAFAALFFLVCFGLAEQFARKEGFNGFSVKAEEVYLNRIAQDLPPDCSSFYVSIGPAGVHNEFEYQIDAALVSIMRHVPTLNGYSGSLPPDWGLWEVKDPAYENNVKQWIGQRQLTGKICRVVINESTSTTDINDPSFFVRQQYRDVLGREPDPAGFNEWLKKLSGCNRQGGLGSDPNCDRVYVSMGIFDSDEFRQRSYFVIRLYQAIYGRMPSYQEFQANRRKIVASMTVEQEEKSKQSLIYDCIQRSEFKQNYDGLTNGDYVDKLLRTALFARLNRDDLVSDLERNRKSRAQVLRLIVDDLGISDALMKRAFVTMQFFANLARSPKDWEYEERLRTLEATGNYRQLVFDFIYSVEYRQRFGYVN